MTSLMNVSWSEVRLAHTRWWLGLGRFGRSVGVSV